MRSYSLYLIVCILAIHLVLAGALGFNFFKKNNKLEAAQADDSEESKDLSAPEVARDEAHASELETKVKQRNMERLEKLLGPMQTIKNQQMTRQSARPDLDKIREATADQIRLQAMINMPKSEGKGAKGDEVLQGGRRRGPRYEDLHSQEARAKAYQDRNRHWLEDEEEEEEEEYEDEIGLVKRNQTNKIAMDLVSRLTAKGLGDQAATKFINTGPTGEPDDSRRPKMNLTRGIAVKRTGVINGEIKKNKLITGAFWSKKLDKAVKITKQGIKGSAKIISEIPKQVERGLDSVNAFLQLDSRGKILALIDEVTDDARFVRREFSQFTLSWSPIMERALNYLGDENLEKIKWNENDELDHRRDAVHSLAFGYEFMNLMIVWRENLLIAHEAFKVYLESVKTEIEQKRLDLDENLVIQLRTTHTYLLLASWMVIEKVNLKARTKLDFLMEIEDDRPKNYESEYFRNIVVLQEMYSPTVEEFDKEREEVVNSISESGVVVSNLIEVDDFFVNFRSALARREITDIDWKVPNELTEFMAKLEPQLRCNSLVYTRTFLREHKCSN